MITAATEADRAALDAYLAARSATCMLIRMNLAAVGLAWSAPAGAKLQGQYVVARREGRIVGVAVHCWNNNVLVQADANAGALVVAALAQSSRPLAGLLGPRDDIAAARAALGARVARVDDEHVVMALALDQLVMPPQLRDGVVRGRRAVAADRELLIAWRVAYLIETGVNRADDPAVTGHATEMIDSSIAAGERWVVEADGAPVAMCAVNTRLPDAAQIGGVFTPPALRSRGHARAVVAAALRATRDAGVTQAMLFTPRPDAVAAYRAVGFVPIDAYAIVLFDEA